jgi:hypothetical protein
MPHKKPDFGNLKKKIKKHFSWDKTKIGFRGVPRYPKGHKRV